MPEQAKTKISLYQKMCGLLIWISRLLSIPLEMLLHVNVGDRYFGFSGFLSLVVMIVWVASTNDSGLLALLMVAYIIRIIIYQFKRGGERDRSSPLRHSRYAGRPLIGFWFNNVEEEKLKTSEAVLTMLLGGAISLVNHPLGNFLLCSGSAMLAAAGVAAAITRDKLLDKLDAEFERQAETAALQKYISGQPERGFTPVYVNAQVLSSNSTPPPLGLIE
ncbi:MAG TPA: hypothetical protein VH088_21450 [Terriglobales bacterium]|jgi:hypothetical protein|nr:hypothetical protein [Terriglobales bacterium]